MLRLGQTLTLLGLLFAGPAWGGEESLGWDLEDLLETKISTAAKYEQTTREAPASVAIITAEDIEAYGYRTLEDVFRSVPGFYVTNDRSYTYLGVRGFSRPTDSINRVLFLVNGVSVNDNVWGSGAISNETPIKTEWIERIEIVRGPGSALYGTYAMFGVVNLILKDGNDIDGVAVTARAGSYGSQEGSLMLGKRLENGVDYLLTGSWTDENGQDLYYPEYDDPETNFGIAEDLDWVKHYNLYGSLAIKDLSVQAAWVSREKGIPTGSYEVLFNDQASRSLEATGFVGLKFDHKMTPATSFRLSGSLHHSEYSGWWPYDPTWTDASSGTWLGNEIQVLWDQSSHSRFTIGVASQYDFVGEYTASDGTGPFYRRDVPHHVLSLYAQQEYQAATHLSFILGVRADKNWNAKSSTTPRGAIVYSPVPTSTLKLLYGEAYRRPSTWEADYEDFAYKFNHDLKHERIRTIEAVWEQRLSSSMIGNLSLYRYKMTDLIDATLDASDEMIQHRNVSEVEAKGVEAGLRLQVKRGFRGYANYAFQCAKAPGAAARLSNSPLHTVKAGLVIPLRNQIQWAAEIMYESGRRTVYNTLTDAYVLTNFNVTYSPLLGPAAAGPFHRVNLAIQINNAFDRSYSLPGGFEHQQAAIAQNGRSYNIELSVKF